MIALEKVFLRALEPEDINVLFSIENDSSLQSFSTHNGPYSRFVLQRYLAQQNQSIYEQQQQRLVISDQSKKALGLIDLFEFESCWCKAPSILIPVALAFTDEQSCI